MVELKGVSKKFDTILFEDFNIIFEKGKTTVLLGNSGCGKTALINILLGFLKPDNCLLYTSAFIRPYGTSAGL